MLTVHWQPPQYDGGAPINYTITVSSGVGTFTTSGTSVPVTVPYNVGHAVSIVATNCNGSSSAAMVIIRIGMLSYIKVVVHLGKYSLRVIKSCTNTLQIGTGNHKIVSLKYKIMSSHNSVIAAFMHNTRRSLNIVGRV